MNSDHGYGAFHGDGIEPDPSYIWDRDARRPASRLTPDQEARVAGWAERWAKEVGAGIAAARVAAGLPRRRGDDPERGK